MQWLRKDQGWTPYIWLVYMVIFAVLPFFFDTSVWMRVATVAATIAGALLYLWGYWQTGRRALFAVIGFFLIGTIFAKFNPGAASFFIYAACLIAKIGRPAVAFRYLAALLALTGLEAWAFQLEAQVWAPALFFSALMGSVIIEEVHRKRLNGKLLLAQGEAQRLAKMAERERIARDLHDLLGHTLSVITLKSELASRLTETDPARAATEIRDVERISREALAQVRAAVTGYRSTGFKSELKEARETLETAGVQVETCGELPRLSPAQEGVFALALREAVTNVVRHAHATFCRLTLKQEGVYCLLEVADNGRGGADVEGNGLSGMRERVQALGGSFECLGECDGARGTLLRIRVPV
jgi:two-component system sensor histidine kinase DesK